METVNELKYEKEVLYNEDGIDYKMVARVSIDDDCRNNVLDWSVTGSIYKISDKGEEWMSGGCVHEEIMERMPELGDFIALHNCNIYGQPSYPVENGIYHLRKSGPEVGMEYLRITREECVQLYMASGDDDYFKYLLFKLGIVDRWNEESKAMIGRLEELCGKKLVNPYKPEEERFVLRMDDIDMKMIENRIFDGYYSGKKTLERMKEKLDNRRQRINDEFDKKIRDIERDRAIDLSVVDAGIVSSNFIYYDSTNRLVFNWTDSRDRVKKEDFERYVREVDRSKLPEDIRFEFNS